MTRLLIDWMSAEKAWVSVTLRDSMIAILSLHSASFCWMSLVSIWHRAWTSSYWTLMTLRSCSFFWTWLLKRSA
jgi:hypothetical protein